MLFGRLLNFSKIDCFQKFLRNIIRVPNNLDLDQARHFVVPDLDQNCLERFNQQITIVGRELIFSLLFQHFDWLKACHIQGNILWEYP